MRLPAAAGEPACAEPARAEIAADAAPDTAIAVLYHAHYRGLVSLAMLLVGDSMTAEEVVQDAFVAMDAATYRQWDTGRAMQSLRASVVIRSRLEVRNRTMATTAVTPAPGAPIDAHGELALIGGPAVVAAWRQLPDLQREVVALRCYCDLPDTQIAAAMGISARAVRRLAVSAMAALRPVLEREP